MTTINNTSNGTVSNCFSASIMSAVAKVYFDGKNIPYTITNDESDRFTDIFNVKLPIKKDVVVDLTLITSAHKKVILRAPSVNYEYTTPDTMRPSEFKKTLPDIINEVREAWHSNNWYGGYAS